MRDWNPKRYKTRTREPFAPTPLEPWRKEMRRKLQQDFEATLEKPSNDE